ncbi:hypothetical protein [Undibacterium rugosum]
MQAPTEACDTSSHPNAD